MSQTLKKEVRDAIIKSARREFLRRGYRNASMRAIAAGTGKTVGNLYRYYKSKEDLFKALVEDLKIDQESYDRNPDGVQMLIERKVEKLGIPWFLKQLNPDVLIKIFEV